jgi:hypothetical protein
MRGIPVPRQEDQHTGVDGANDPALMAICCMGAGHPGSIPRAVRGFQYLYVTIYKFTKWSEATLVVKINMQSTVKFTKSIMCMFWVSNRIITNKGS